MHNHLAALGLSLVSLKASTTSPFFLEEQRYILPSLSKTKAGVQNVEVTLTMVGGGVGVGGRANT